MPSAEDFTVDATASLLIDAVTRQDVAAVEALLADDVDVDVRDNNGNTALMWAAWNGLPEMAEFLIGKGASLTAVNHVGKTAARLAGESRANQIEDDGATCARFDATIAVFAAADESVQTTRAEQEEAAQAAVSASTAQQNRAELRKYAPRVRFSR